MNIEKQGQTVRDKRLRAFLDALECFQRSFLADLQDLEKHGIITLDLLKKALLWKYGQCNFQDAEVWRNAPKDELIREEALSSMSWAELDLQSERVMRFTRYIAMRKR